MIIFYCIKSVAQLFQKLIVSGKILAEIFFVLLSQKANLNVPNDIKQKIQIINTFNISSRYDDYKKSFSQKCTDANDFDDIYGLYGRINGIDLGYKC